MVFRGRETWFVGLGLNEVEVRMGLFLGFIVVGEIEGTFIYRVVFIEY